MLRHHPIDDMEMFMEAARHPTEENTHLLWLSRRCGTECFRERDVYLKESQASHTWTPAHHLAMLRHHPIDAVVELLIRAAGFGSVLKF